MNQASIKVSAILLFVIIAFSVQAQETLSATGVNTSGSGGSSSYSVGQLVYNMHSGGNTKVGQGVQQPYEISSVTSIEDDNIIALTANVYPNPTADFLLLEIERSSTDALLYEMYDMAGNVVLSQTTASRESRIEMSGLAASTYLLKITENGEQIRTFKIIKN